MRYFIKYYKNRQKKPKEGWIAVRPLLPKSLKVDSDPFLSKIIHTHTQTMHQFKPMSRIDPSIPSHIDCPTFPPSIYWARILFRKKCNYIYLYWGTLCRLRVHTTDSGGCRTQSTESDPAGGASASFGTNPRSTTAAPSASSGTSGSAAEAAMMAKALASLTAGHHQQNSSGSSTGINKPAILSAILRTAAGWN